MLSLRSNGILAKKKKKIFNSFDKARITFPSFNKKSYRKVTKRDMKIDLSDVVKISKIPLKLSMLITRYNMNEISDYIGKSKGLGIMRIVLRKLKGLETLYPVEDKPPFDSSKPKRYILGNPVYLIDGCEVTIWDFSSSKARGIFLFPDGSLTDRLCNYY